MQYLMIKNGLPLQFAAFSAISGKLGLTAETRKFKQKEVTLESLLPKLTKMSLQGLLSSDWPFLKSNISI